MNKSLAGIKVAVLVSNGFCEEDLTEAQRMLIAHGATFKVISLDHGLVNSWSGQNWGHHFAIDGQLSSALAADYSMLVLPGGRRSIEKLKLTAHTRRFIGGFMAASKPVAVCGSALNLMVFADQIRGMTVAGPDYIRESAERVGAKWSEEGVAVHGNLITGVTGDKREEFIRAVADHFAGYASSGVSKAA